MSYCLWVVAPGGQYRRLPKWRGGKLQALLTAFVE